MHEAEQGRNEKGNGGWDKMTGKRITWGTREGEKGKKFVSLIYSNLLEGMYSKYRNIVCSTVNDAPNKILRFSHSYRKSNRSPV